MPRKKVVNEPMGFEEWGSKQPHVRSYELNVVERLKRLPEDYRAEVYGITQYGPYSYPLYRVQIGDWEDKTKPAVLITGGVHGYEEAGVESALAFMETVAADYKDQYRFLVYPCISPSAYEIDSRWNLNDEDPNRNFGLNSSQPENKLFWDSLKHIDCRFLMTMDLHEALAKDKEIMARQARKESRKTGKPVKVQWDESSIPKDFFIYEDCPDKNRRLGSVIISAVEKITPVCKWDTIGGDKNDGGVMYPEGADCNSDYALPKDPADLPKCMDSFLRAVGITSHAFTTETYATDMPLEKRIAVQLTVIKAALDGAKGRPAPLFTPSRVPA